MSCWSADICQMRPPFVGLNKNSRVVEERANQSHVDGLLAMSPFTCIEVTRVAASWKYSAIARTYFAADELVAVASSFSLLEGRHVHVRRKQREATMYVVCSKCNRTKNFTVEGHPLVRSSRIHLDGRRSPPTTRRRAKT